MEWKCARPRELRAIWVVGNEYLQSGSGAHSKKTRNRLVHRRLALNLIRFYAVVSSPFIPDAAAMMSAMKTQDASWPRDVKAALGAPPAGHAFEVQKLHSANY